MTNLHGWRMAGGWPVRPKQRPCRRRRTLASRLVQEAPAEADTIEARSTPWDGALGVALAVGVSAALWAVIVGGCYLLLR